MARGAAVRGALALAAAFACTPHETDPFQGVDRVSTTEPARSLALFRVGEETWIAAAFEIQGEVRLYRRVDRWEALTEIGVGAGPRAIAAGAREGGGVTLATADAAGRSVTMIDVQADGRLAKQIWPVGDPAPLQVAAGGRGVFFVVRGEGEGAIVERWRRGPLGWNVVAAPVPFATLVAGVDRDRDGDLDAVVARRTRGDLATLSVDADRETLTDEGATPICDEPRALAPWPGGGLAVACRDGVALWGADGRAIAYDGELYDLVAADLDGDAVVDLAAPDLAAHALVVWLGGRDPVLYPVSAGPVALRAGDVDSDGDLDLVSIGFEARSLDVLTNGLIP